MKRAMAAVLVAFTEGFTLGVKAGIKPKLGGSSGDGRRALVEKWCGEHTTDEVC